MVAKGKRFYMETLDKPGRTQNVLASCKTLRGSLSRAVVLTKYVNQSALAAALNITEEQVAEFISLGTLPPHERKERGELVWNWGCGHKAIRWLAGGGLNLCRRVFPIRQDRLHNMPGVAGH